MNAPCPDELQRELEQVRAASTATPGPPQPSVRKLMLKGPLKRFVLGWLALILAFSAIWIFLNPNK